MRTACWVGRDRQCRLCFSTALWNGQDPILKERLFGLGNPEGNHGEDVKEQLLLPRRDADAFVLQGAVQVSASAPSPTKTCVAENKRRGYDDLEYELLDTGIFDESRYFDVLIEYAKADAEDTLIRITASNRGPDAAPLHLLPTLTLRNNWSWRNLEARARRGPMHPQTRRHRRSAPTTRSLGDYPLLRSTGSPRASSEAALHRERHAICTGWIDCQAA